MPNQQETQRIAAVMHALRPEWRPNSLETFLARHHGNRSYADLLIAAVVVAMDERTKTPELLNQHGRWWVAAQQVFTAEATPTVGPGKEPRCEVYGHEFQAARTCAHCRTERLATGTWPTGTRHQQAGPSDHQPDARTLAANDHGDEL